MPYAKEDSDTIENNFQRKNKFVQIIFGPKDNRKEYKINIRDRYQTPMLDDRKFRAIKRGTEDDPIFKFV